MLRPTADHRVHQDYISDHLELTGERKEEEEEKQLGSLTSDNFRFCHKDHGETMTSVSGDHIIMISSNHKGAGTYGGVQTHNS